MEAIAAVAIMTPGAGQADEMQKHLASLGDLTRQEPGNRNYSVIKLDSTPPRFVVFEVFENREAYEAHEKNPDVTSVASTITAILAGADILTGVVVDSGAF